MLITVSGSLTPSYATTPWDLFPAEHVNQDFEDALQAYNSGQFEQAYSLAKIAADTGVADAQVMVAYMSLRGEAGAIDYASAAEYYRKAAEQENSDAYMGLGEMSLRSLAGLTPSDALQWFKAATKLGRQDAMRAIGEMYVKGQGVAPNPDKAQYWLERASESGDINADRKMADSLFTTNPVQALKYYEKAANAGDYEAAYIAAIMYEENFHIKPDSKRMAELMLQAAQSGHTAAQADYGLLVYQGRGVARSQSEAAQWFEKSALGGDSEGQFLYAFTLAKGEGVEKDFEEAYYWLLKSGESGVSDYDQDRILLRERLEENVDPAILAKARLRLTSN